jgi:hypothetical protein
MARFELVFIEVADGHRDVLLFTARIGKPKINEFHFVIGDHLHNVLGVRHPDFSLKNVVLN